MQPRTVVRPVATLAVALLFAGSAQAQSFPLVCQAGSMLRLSLGFITDRTFGTLGFQPSNQAASAGVAPGHCAWTDRGWRPGEPTTLYFPDLGRVTTVFGNGAYQNFSFIHNDVRNLERITRDGGGTFVFQVHRQGNAMQVDRVGP